LQRPGLGRENLWSLTRSSGEVFEDYVAEAFWVWMVYLAQTRKS